MSTLEVKVFGRTLKNPVLTASGTFGFGEEFAPFMDVSSLGGIIGKGLTVRPYPGNAGIRVMETPSGMMNSIGLQNPGVEHFIERELPIMKCLSDFAVANLGGHSAEDYEEGMRLLDRSDVDAVELNISCPNVRSGGMAFGIRCEDAGAIVARMRPLTAKPLIVKLSPNAYEIVRLAKTVEAEGADAVSLVNTFQAMAIDTRLRKPVFRNVTAGLSGPAIRPIALRMVYDVAKAVSIPVVGLGGIDSLDAALQFLMAGATLVQIGTANLTDPQTAGRIVREMELWAEREGLSSIEEIRGIIG